MMFIGMENDDIYFNEKMKYIKNFEIVRNDEYMIVVFYVLLILIFNISF